MIAFITSLIVVALSVRDTLNSELFSAPNDTFVFPTIVSPVTVLLPCNTVAVYSYTGSEGCEGIDEEEPISVTLLLPVIVPLFVGLEPIL